MICTPLLHASAEKNLGKHASCTKFKCPKMEGGKKSKK